MNTNSPVYNIYSPELIDFTAVGVEFATLVETPTEARELVLGLLQILPRLYLQTMRLPEYLYSPEEDYIEEYITEYGYERVRGALADVLGEQDTFLRLSAEDAQGEQTPTLSFISECLADVYQHVGNLLGIVKERNELALPAAIGRCLALFREYWGEQLLTAQMAIHRLYVQYQSEHDDAEEDAYQED